MASVGGLGVGFKIEVRWLFAAGQVVIEWWRFMLSLDRPTSASM